MASATRNKVAHFASPYLQPTETFIYDRIASHSRYEPFVLTDERPVNLDLFPFSNIQTLDSLPAAARKWQNALRRTTGALPFFVDAVRREKPSVLHAHYGPVGAAVLPVALRTGVPLMASFYGMDASALLLTEKYKAEYEKLWRGAALISVLSEDMRKRLTAAGCPEAKIRIHHLAVDIDALRPPDMRPDAPPVKIFCSSRLVEKKGVDTLLRAVAEASKQVDIQLDVAGTGPLGPELGALAENLGIAERVKFLGRVPRERVFEMMRGSHIFALLSRTAKDGDSEGTPTALIEAGAFALPCVSTMHAGIPEVIEHGATGLLVDENDPAAAASAITQLASDPALREKMGAAAAEKIAHEFSIRTVMKQIETDYDSLQ